MMKKILLALLIVFSLGTGAALYLAIAYPANSPAVATALGTAGGAAGTSGGSAATGSSGGYTTTEIAAHSSPSDCWLIVRGNVYDVTSYIPSHPGGRRNITNVCGKEVTSIFAAIHSNRAWDLLGRYKIGAVTTTPANRPAAAPTTASVADAEKDVSAAVTAALPGATVLSVHPFGGGYTALVSMNNKLVDVVTDAQGSVLSQTTRRDELEWFWSSDDDEIEEWHEDEKENETEGGWSGRFDD